MRVLFINSVCGIGSTGRICADLALEYEAKGYEVKIAYGRTDNVPDEFKKFAIRIGTKTDIIIHGLLSRLFDSHGLGSKKATELFLEWADKYNPDVLWLHNIHGYYINYKSLFEWIKKRPLMKVKWTLHDCWAFTGHCTYFSAINCIKWHNGCKNCEQINKYPKSLLLDRSRQNYDKKKEAFLGVKDLTIITPSKWLSNLVKQSYLNCYPIEVHYNRVNYDLFKPTPSQFKEKFDLTTKKVILGVASVWEERKGFNDFLELSKLLDDSFRIVLVGVNKKQKAILPNNIIGIEHTNNLNELAQLYSMADVFVNPSREETFGMTTVEATLCGTKAIVFKGTACEEIINIYGGVAVEQSVDSLYKAIIDTLGNEQRSNF